MAIEHKRLGKRGVLVSNICLGTMNFGWHTAQEESFKIMDRALELGINFFEQLKSALRATEITLAEETLNRLDEIFPGPGGEAPMAYAW